MFRIYASANSNTILMQFNIKPLKKSILGQNQFNEFSEIFLKSFSLVQNFRSSEDFFIRHIVGPTKIRHNYQKTNWLKNIYVLSKNVNNENCFPEPILLEKILFREILRILDISNNYGITFLQILLTSKNSSPVQSYKPQLL